MATAVPADAVLVRPVRRDLRTGWLRLWAEYHAYGRTGATALPDAVTGITWERFFQGARARRGGFALRRRSQRQRSERPHSGGLEDPDGAP
jgi:hypothetical protein